MNTRPERALDRTLKDAPMRTLDRPPPRIELRHCTDGVLYLGSGYELAEPRPLIMDYLQWAMELRPDTTFIAERDSNGQWRRLTYASAWRDTTAVATWLIRKGFGPGGAPIMILSENSIEHALLTLGALRAGAPAVPISPAYSLSNDLSRLGYALELIQPGLVFASDPVRYAAALGFAASESRLILCADDIPQMLQHRDDAAVQARRTEIADDTIAKILLTSGSTGRSKGVVNTHGNLAAAVQMIKQVSEPFKAERVDSYVDWLPWHHTYGGNAQFNSVLAFANSLYIDTGRPLPGQFEITMENLRDISPAGFGCVPAAYGMLATAMEHDTDLRHKFFKNLRWLSYGGALLPQPLWERMQRLAVQELGERLPFGTGWGMTETAAVGVSIYWNVERTGFVGLPQPGVTLKLVPAQDRLEMRIRGANVLPRYYRNDELTAAAFDEEGFFRTGDAVRWVDANQPLAGLEYAGRITEDFKLLSGTWVQASLVRRDLVEALQPHVMDAVICAPNRPWLGAMVWLRVSGSDVIRADLAHALAAFNATRRGSSETINRLLILTSPPSPQTGEITDKGSINQRCAIEHRLDEVASLYADPATARIILPMKQADSRAEVRKKMEGNPSTVDS